MDGSSRCRRFSHMPCPLHHAQALRDVQKEVPCLQPSPPLATAAALPSPASPCSTSSHRRKGSGSISLSGSSRAGGFSLTLTSPFSSAGKKRARAQSHQQQQQEQQEEQGDEEKGENGDSAAAEGEEPIDREEEAAAAVEAAGRLPVRVLVVSHGGLLLQMFQKASSQALSGMGWHGSEMAVACAWLDGGTDCQCHPEPNGVISHV